MDPLSITSAVAGLLTLTAQIATTVCKLYSSVNDAPASIPQIEEEMSDLHLMFCQVQLFIGGSMNMANKSGLTLISLHQLMATLSGCVLICSTLDKKLNDVAGLRGAGANTAELLVGRIKWALWKEAEVKEVIGDLQQHKSSLNLMLNIIQCCNLSEATQSLSQLQETIAKILQSKHEIRQSNHEIFIQLRDLIKRNERNDEGADIRPPIASQPNTEHDNESACNYTPGSLPTPGPPTTDFSNHASFKSAVTSLPIRSRSRSMSSLLLPSFTEDVSNSTAYKREVSFRRGGGNSSHSAISFNTLSIKGDTWSMLSGMTLGGLQISEISVLDLPICLSDLHNPTPFQEASATTSKHGRGLLEIALSSRGMPGRAMRANAPFALRTLIDLGADIEEVDSNGDTPLLYLLKHKGVNWGFDNPGMSILQLLLDKGANVNSTDFTGRTPLSYAGNTGHSRVCVLLLEKGTNVNSTDSTGRTPLSYAANAGELYTCRLLLEKGANVNSGDSTGRTPLSYAAASRWRPEEMCELLLENGANVNSTDTAGRTPLSYAAEAGRPKVCNLLLEKAGNVNSADAAGRTPLSYAADVGYLSVCMQLLEKGANLNSTDSTGRTPLSYAAGARCSSQYICELLLENGANVNSTDSTGRTPLSYATAADHGYVCTLLKDKGAIN